MSALPDEEPDEELDEEPRERPERSDRDRDNDEFPGVDQLIGTFMQEASLWPVLAVVLGSGGAFTAALMILSFVDRNPFAALALLLILGLTVDVAFRARRHAGYRNGARLLLLIWGAGIAFAGLAVWSGIAFSS